SDSGGRRGVGPARHSRDLYDRRRRRSPLAGQRADLSVDAPRVSTVAPPMGQDRRAARENPRPSPPPVPPRREIAQADRPASSAIRLSTSAIREFMRRTP